MNLLSFFSLFQIVLNLFQQAVWVFHFVMLMKIHQQPLRTSFSSPSLRSEHTSSSIHVKSQARRSKSPSIESWNNIFFHTLELNWIRELVLCRLSQGRTIHPSGGVNAPWRQTHAGSDLTQLLAGNNQNQTWSELDLKSQGRVMVACDSLPELGSFLVCTETCEGSFPEIRTLPPPCHSHHLQSVLPESITNGKAWHYLWKTLCVLKCG